MNTVLLRRRTELDWNQARLAARVGCTQQAVSKWERGLCAIRERRHRRMLEAIFDCPVSELEKENSPDPKAEAVTLTDSRRTGEASA